MTPPHPAAHPERKNTGVVQGTVVVIPAGSRRISRASRTSGVDDRPESITPEKHALTPTFRPAKRLPRTMFHNPKFKVFVDLIGSPNTDVYRPRRLRWNSIMPSGQRLEQVLHTGHDAESSG
jgi:hypothetical protein